MKQFTRKKKAKKDDKVAYVAKRLRLLKLELEKVKPLYREMDELTDLAIEHNIDLTPYGLALEDNFETKNTAWRATAMRRFEVVILPGRFQEPEPTHRHEVKQAPKQHSFKFPVRRSR